MSINNANLYHPFVESIFSTSLYPQQPISVQDSTLSFTTWQGHQHIRHWQPPQKCRASHLMLGCYSFLRAVNKPLIRQHRTKYGICRCLCAPKHWICCTCSLSSGQLIYSQMLSFSKHAINAFPFLTVLLADRLHVLLKVHTDHLLLFVFLQCTWLPVIST